MYLKCAAPEFYLRKCVWGFVCQDKQWVNNMNSRVSNSYSHGVAGGVNKQGSATAKVSVQGEKWVNGEAVGPQCELGHPETQPSSLQEPLLKAAPPPDISPAQDRCQQPEVPSAGCSPCRIRQRLHGTHGPAPSGQHKQNLLAWTFPIHLPFSDICPVLHLFSTLSAG